MRTALLVLCAFASCSTPPRTDLDGLFERLDDSSDVDAERLLVEGGPEVDERLPVMRRRAFAEARIRIGRIERVRENRRLGPVQFLADGVPTTCEADGSERRPAGTADAARDPALSPDGTWRAEATGLDGDEEIVLRGPEGVTRRITHEPGRDYDPAWSCDGRRLAIVTERDGDPEVYVVNLETLHVLRLTHSPGPDGSPRWSKDSTTVYFVSERDGRPQIYRVGRARGALRRISDGTTDDRLR